MGWEELGGILLAVAVFVFFVVGWPMLRERRHGLASVSSISSYQMPWAVRLSQPTPAPRSKNVMSTKQKRDVVKRHKTRLSQRKTRTIPAIPVQTEPQTRPADQQKQVDIKTVTWDDDQREVVKELLKLGVSGNKIITLVKGDRNTRLKQIAAIRSEIEEEKRVEHAAALAKEVAQPDLEVPDVEPIPLANAA